MQYDYHYLDVVPRLVPEIMNGTLNYRIVIKKDHTRTDGTNALYLELFQNRRRKRVPIGISVPMKDFDSKAQRVRGNSKKAKSCNLVIGKILADLNKILINYKLSDKYPSMEMVLDELVRPTSRINFNEFAKAMLQRDRANLKYSTYRQQKGSLSKIRRFRDPIHFSEIDEQFVKDLRAWCKHDLENRSATIESTVKTLKKFVHMANRKGIHTPISYEDISVRKMTGPRVFLLPEELKKLYRYYQSEFINESHKKVLCRFLFSCFTGIRISDSEQLTAENFIGDHLALTMVKTDKFIRIRLNDTARSLISLPDVFEDNFTREHINRELKDIARMLGIKKRLHFHCSRHTFATNFLITGGSVVNLQRILGHSKIEQTMVYVHIVESFTDDQINMLDDLVK